MNARIVSVLALGLVSACGSTSEDPPSFEQRVTQGMHDALLTDIKTLHSSAVKLQSAAPVGHGWDAVEDADAIAKMTAQWNAARGAYERIEGALAPLFPETDYAIDARYEDFLEENGPDEDLFDDQGVTGMHAIERILYAETIPANVIAVEETLVGYKSAAYPASKAEASDFKGKLCERFVKDTEMLQADWESLNNIDVRGAFQGLIDLMNEQREKINKAASDEEESRYSERTMADIRQNLAGTKKIYVLFRDELLTKPKGKAIDGDIQDSFDKLDQAYKAVDGDAFPELPSTWSSETPTEADLETPFGRLFTSVQDAVNPNISGSLVDGMERAARALGFPEVTE